MLSRQQQKKKLPKVNKVSAKTNPRTSKKPAFRFENCIFQFYNFFVKLAETCKKYGAFFFSTHGLRLFFWYKQLNRLRLAAHQFFRGTYQIKFFAFADDFLVNRDFRQNISGPGPDIIFFIPFKNPSNRTCIPVFFQIVEFVRRPDPAI